jgi:hypothetical protein
MRVPEHVMWIIIALAVLFIGFFFYFVLEGGGIQYLSKIFGFMNIFG